jgi:hypothetical protein
MDVNSGGLGLWFEDRMNQLDGWRMRRDKHLPEAIEKPYWHDDAFAEDSVRLAALGYSVESETHNDSYVSSSYPANTGGGFGQLTRTITRRVPSIHVTYRRRATGQPLKSARRS